MMKDTYRAIADIVENSDSFLITSHIDPDGDAVGSALAICSILKRLGKGAKVILEDGIPAAFAFLEGTSEVLTSKADPAEVAIVVDAASLDRLGWVEDLVRKCGVIVNIDHHGSNNNFGHHNLVVRGAGACGEVIYRLVEVMGSQPTAAEAEALYVAILSDTGCFRFPNTTSDTHRIAARLLDLGAKPYRTASEIFWKRSPAALRLLGSALSTIEITNGGMIASMEVTRRMFEETGADSRDTEGFANYPRSIRNVQVGILIRETEPGRFRVSLRAREGYSIDEIAKSFGGGGHPTAAGFRTEGDLPRVKERLRSEIHTRVLKPDITSNR
jgi:phosphoesterase RecJ-like protein